MGLGAATYEATSTRPPLPVRELRGAWVATVANIDWPSTNNLSTAPQKAELVAMLDRAADLRLNAIIFQVRPGCDAMYASSLEPWSEYLTGTMGKAPEPFYDPLTFAVEEAHRRGLELHAWFNPYRARHGGAKTPASANHVSRTRPQLVRQYGRSLWLDPGEPAVQDYSLSVILDVVRRYDIDGVHIDDYFYPYPERDASGREIGFPDETSWKRFGANRGLSRDDWRRENVDTFVRRVYQGIKAAKPWVKFGISPFGIWRPATPAQIRGFDAYEKLYADSRKWLVNGWCDYFAPQLYWAIDPPEQSFPVLLRWWESQNRKGRLLAPGLDTTKALRRWPAEEILNQIRRTRQESGAAGHVHWNMKSLMRNSELCAELKATLYAQPAVVPACRWLGAAAPPQPTLKANAEGGTLRLSWSLPAAETVSVWVVQTRDGAQWATRVVPGKRNSMELKGGLPGVVSVTAVNRLGNASRAAVLKRSEEGG